jgi:hypothetical protein
VSAKDFPTNKAARQAPVERAYRTDANQSCEQEHVGIFQPLAGLHELLRRAGVGIRHWRAGMSRGLRALPDRKKLDREAPG